MKRIQLFGMGTIKRQAELLTDGEEELLWQTGKLGHSPQTLVDTMIFMNRMLRSGVEHCNLRHDPPQIEKLGERAYLKYMEDISKNHPGG